MPQSGEELKQTLQDALAQTTPLNDFVQIIKDLTWYELQHGLSSEEFYSRFEAGELGDDIELIRWANKYEIYLESKGEFEQLMTLVESYALPVMV